MNASDRWKILQNIVAQQGIEVDLYSELAKAEQMIAMIDQGKMMPPPVPPEITQPMAPPTEQMPTEPETNIGKYDNL